MQTRRAHLAGLAGAAAAALLPRVAGAQARVGAAAAAPAAAAANIPPEGIGRGIRHVRTATKAAAPTACR